MAKSAYDERFERLMLPHMDVAYTLAFWLTGNDDQAQRQIPTSEVIPEAVLVPSGIAEIGRLQSREGYAYMRL